MRINSITNISVKNIAFSAQKNSDNFLASEKDPNTNVFAYDDMMSQQRRAFIRKHFEENNLPPSKADEEEIYKRHLKISEEIKKPKKPTKKIPEWYSIFEEGIYSGALSEQCIRELEGTSVDCIISFAPSPLKEKAAKEIGVKYVPLKYLADENLYSTPPFQEENDKTEEVRLFIEQDLIPFIQTIQNRKGDIVMGCEYGEYRTCHAITINNWFNPKNEYNFMRLSQMEAKALENLMNKLTPEDKKALQIDEEFEKEFRENIQMCKNDPYSFY